LEISQDILNNHNNILEGDFLDYTYKHWLKLG